MDPNYTPSPTWTEYPSPPTYKDFTVDELLAGGASPQAAASLVAARLIFRASLAASPQGTVNEMSVGLAQRAGSIDLETKQVNIEGAIPTGIILNETPVKSGASAAQLMFRTSNVITVLFADQKCTIIINNSHPNPTEFMWFQLYPEPADTAKSFKCGPL